MTFAEMLRAAIEEHGARFVERLRALRAIRGWDRGPTPIDYAAGPLHVLSVMTGIPDDTLRAPSKPLCDIDIRHVAHHLGIDTAPLIEAAEAERTAAHRIADAADIIGRYASYDGDHHKQWVFDQALRAMLGPAGYAAWVAEQNSDSDCSPWDEGSAP